VLDEADSLLDMGFREDIEAIMKMMPPTPERQTFMFSATVSKGIQQIAREVLDPNHAFINCVSEDSPVHAHVPQYHTVLPSAKDQLPHILRSLAHDQLANPKLSKTIIFFPTTKMTQLFHSLLREASKTTLPAGRNTEFYEIHSKKSQDQRTRASNAFRAEKTGSSVLITSDVSARGVDYPGVTRVIQVGIPPTADVYVHRVGRTGRAGTQGRGDLILLPWETGFVTWQMNSIPLKTVTVDEMASQVEELATEADNKSSHIPNKKPYLTTLKSIDEGVQELLTMVDEEAVKETLMSNLGYYVGKSSQLTCPGACYHRRTEEVVRRRPRAFQTSTHFRIISGPDSVFPRRGTTSSVRDPLLTPAALGREPRLVGQTEETSGVGMADRADPAAVVGSRKDFNGEDSQGRDGYRKQRRHSF
jgi:ATP-dependent RNA helicase MSS116